jgi:urea carboxylase
MAAGRGAVEVTDGEFSLSAYQDFLATDADAIDAFRQRQGSAFAAERARWDRAGEFQRAS